MVHDDPGAFVLYCTKQKMSLFILGWSKMKLYKSLDKSALKESSLKFLKLEYLGFTDFIVFFSRKTYGETITYGKGWYKTFYYSFWICGVNVINNSRD